jgi:integrase
MARKKRKTFGDYAKYMNKLLRFAYQRRYLSHLIKVDSPDPIATGVGRVFTESEIKALWGVMNDETRDQFVLCYECFMRLREALYLTWDRVDLNEKEISLRASDVKTGSRTGKGRTFRASHNAIERLRIRYEQRSSDKWVFPSRVDSSKPVEDNKTAWRAAKRRCAITGRARWHDLRHTAISRSLLERGMDPILVSEYAGVSLKTLQRVYLHSTAKQTAAIANSLSVFGEKGSQAGHKRKTV